MYKSSIYNSYIVTADQYRPSIVKTANSNELAVKWFGRHGHNLKGESPEHAWIVGSV